MSGPNADLAAAAGTVDFRFVDGVREAVAAAREAAGDRYACATGSRDRGWPLRVDAERHRLGWSASGRDRRSGAVVSESSSALSD
jgi:hypothetical protein